MRDGSSFEWLLHHGEQVAEAGKFHAKKSAHEYQRAVDTVGTDDSGTHLREARRSEGIAKAAQAFSQNIAPQILTGDSTRSPRRRGQ